MTVKKPKVRKNAKFKERSLNRIEQSEYYRRINREKKENSKGE